MVVSRTSSQDQKNQIETSIDANLSMEAFDRNFGALSPAQFEALMPDPKLKETLSPEDYAALMPDWNRLESDEPEMESSQHYMQLLLLVSCLEYLWRDRVDFFIGANLTIYYSPEQVKTRDYRGPDFFLVKNTAHRPRRSWVIWEEDYQFPNVIIELLSLSTESVDRNFKKTLYAETFKTQEYFWFHPDPEKLELRGFRLVDGAYVEITPNPQGHLWSEELGLFLGLEGVKLRYFYLTGAIVRTSEEDAIHFAHNSDRSELNRTKSPTITMMLMWLQQLQKRYKPSSVRRSPPSQ
jgi:Uma2 family endonuclease